MRKVFNLLVYMLISLGLLVIECGENSEVSPSSSIQQKGCLEVQFRITSLTKKLAKSKKIELNRLTITLNGDNDSTYAFTIDSNDSLFQCTIDSLYPGSCLIELSVFDNNDSVIYDSSENTRIESGITTHIVFSDLSPRYNELMLMTRFLNAGISPILQDVHRAEIRLNNEAVVDTFFSSSISIGDSMLYSNDYLATSGDLEIEIVLFNEDDDTLFRGDTSLSLSSGKMLTVNLPLTYVGLNLGTPVIGSISTDISLISIGEINITSTFTVKWYDSLKTELSGVSRFFHDFSDLETIEQAGTASDHQWRIGPEKTYWFPDGYTPQIEEKEFIRVLSQRQGGVTTRKEEFQSMQLIELSDSGEVIFGGVQFLIDGDVNSDASIGLEQWGATHQAIVFTNNALGVLSDRAGFCKSPDSCLWENVYGASTALLSHLPLVIRIKWETPDIYGMCFKVFFNNEDTPRAQISNVQFMSASDSLRIRLNANRTDDSDGNERILCDYIAVR